jgi:hypothetical protein
MARRALAGSAALAAAASLLVTTGSAAVTRGTVTPNRGAAGVKLGITRAQVIARLGQPAFKNGNGYLQYGNDKLGIGFDVYVDMGAKPPRVRALGINGAGFCLAGGGPCLMTNGGVGRLRDRYGKALETVKLEDGEHVVWLKSTYGGCKVFTDFGAAGRPRSARIGMVFIGYQSGHYC